MNIDVKECSYEDIKFIPKLLKKYLGYARFVKRKKPEIWFKAVKKNSNIVVGAGCLVILSKNTVRHSNDFVLPLCRGQKIMQEIVKRREQWAKENGYKYIDVRTVKKYYENHNYINIKDYKVGGSWYRKEIN
jgi:GNAT superfamily N-acetyltransferase